MADLIVRASEFAKAAPGANTNILSESITPKMGGAFRVTVVLAVASVFNVRASNGSTAYTWGLNRSVALSAGDIYTFTFGVVPAESYNFQVETDGIIQKLQVDEVTSGEL